mgnify:CR=1 FL=1
MAFGSDPLVEQAYKTNLEGLRAFRKLLKPAGWNLHQPIPSPEDRILGSRKFSLIKDVGPFFIEIRVYMVMDPGSQSGTLWVKTGRGKGPILDIGNYTKGRPKNTENYVLDPADMAQIQDAFAKEFANDVFRFPFQGNGVPYAVVERAAHWVLSRDPSWTRLATLLLAPHKGQKAVVTVKYDGTPVREYLYDTRQDALNAVRVMQDKDLVTYEVTTRRA